MRDKDRQHVMLVPEKKWGQGCLLKRQPKAHMVGAKFLKEGWQQLTFKDAHAKQVI